MSKQIVFDKVSSDDPGVVALAKASGNSPSAVASAVNQQRYRSAYNKARQEEMKVLRRLVRENPELLTPKESK